MSDAEGSNRPGNDQRRVLQQLDRLVSSGRITSEEADRLREAGDAGAFETVLAEIRARHAGADLDAAVADGQLTRPEANDLLRRLRRGEHSPGLRKNIRQWRSLHRRPPGDDLGPSR